MNVLFFFWFPIGFDPATNRILFIAYYIWIVYFILIYNTPWENL